MFNSILSGELTLVNFLICIGVAFVLGPQQNRQN